MRQRSRSLKQPRKQPRSGKRARRSSASHDGAPAPAATAEQPHAPDVESNVRDKFKREMTRWRKTVNEEAWRARRLPQLDIVRQAVHEAERSASAQRFMTGVKEMFDRAANAFPATAALSHETRAMLYVLDGFLHLALRRTNEKAARIGVDSFTQEDFGEMCFVHLRVMCCSELPRSSGSRASSRWG